MKTQFFIVFVFLYSCNFQSKKNYRNEVDTTIVSKNNSFDKSSLYSKEDIITIESPHFDTIKYSKKEFNEIIDNFPSLYLSIPVNPDISYAQSGYFKDVIETNGNKKHLSFGSEQGQDKYYILYAYFLQKKQKGKDLDIVRQNLINIYQNINEIFTYLNYGGSFFTHQYYRINGYAEYGVYEYNTFSDIYMQIADIKSLKQLYIKSLKETIHKKLEFNEEFPLELEKSKIENELLKYVQNIDKMITNNFYLMKAQQFQYSYY